MIDETPLGSPITIVDPSGRPARKTVKDEHCPRCGAPPSARIASGGFGQVPYPICGKCGHEWHGEVFGG